VPPKSNEFSMVITQNQQEQYDTQFTEEATDTVSVNGECLYLINIIWNIVLIIIHKLSFM